uniref:Uncharacterized protein LOC104242588 n=1 Tax=Nicotiana sylvestris TaxID=4096 RepID=A0A1U7Y1Y4_NICSY|nr:PREDICTED: uncharacterized protein LOC104242588 [Nicotiana sylvestris]
MLARKTIAFGALRKVLNEKLKASQRKESPTQESNSSSESEAFISTNEGEEHGSSDTAKIQETPGEVSSCVVLSIVVENVENRFVLVGPVKDVKGDESSRSGEGWASYDPKKRKASTQKAPTTSKSTKKSKMSSPKPTVPSVPKGRATRSRVRQSKAELQKALEESKKKKKEKGKAKSVESSEVKITEEEEEEEFEKEQDRFAIFGRRKFLKGRLLRDLDEPGMRRLVDALAAQGWKDMVLEMDDLVDDLDDLCSKAFIEY